MAPTQESVEVAAAPSDHDIDPRIECRGDGAKAIQRDPIDVPPLDQGDRRRGHPGKATDIRLPQAPPQTYPTERETDVSIIHARDRARERFTVAYPSRSRSSRTTSQCASRSENRRASSAAWAARSG